MPDRPIFSCQWKVAKTKYRWQLSNISPWPTNRDRRKIEWKQMQILIVEIVWNKHWKYPVMATRQIERPPIKFYDHTCNNILSAIHTSACHVSNWPEHRLVINWSPHLPQNPLKRNYAMGFGVCEGLLCESRTRREFYARSPHKGSLRPPAKKRHFGPDLKELNTPLTYPPPFYDFPLMNTFCSSDLNQ